MTTTRRSISNLFRTVLFAQNQFSIVGNPAMTERQDAITNASRSLGSDIRRELLNLPVDRLQVRHGGRQYNYAPIPWIRIFDQRKSSSAMRGFYLVYLFSADGSRVYLSLNQGTSEFRGGQYRPIVDPKVIRQRSNDAISRLESLFSPVARLALHRVDLAVDSAKVKSEGKRRIRNYEHGNILAVEYRRQDLPDDQHLLSDLQQMVPALLTLYDGSPPTGYFGSGGESEEHKRIKKEVALHPEWFGLDRSAVPKEEYYYRSSMGDLIGDHVDVLFEGGGVPATVVEVELSEERKVLVGCYQAVKYRTLAALERDLPEHAIKAYVAALNVKYATVQEFCKRDGIQLVEVPAG